MKHPKGGESVVRFFRTTENVGRETTTTEISKERQPTTLKESEQIAQQGGQIAGNTRKEIEAQTGRNVISSLNAKDLNVIGPNGENE